MGNCCDVSDQHNTPKINCMPQAQENCSETENKEESIKQKQKGNQYMQQQLFKEAIAAYIIKDINNVIFLNKIQKLLEFTLIYKQQQKLNNIKIHFIVIQTLNIYGSKFQDCIQLLDNEFQILRLILQKIGVNQFKLSIFSYKSFVEHSIYYLLIQEEYRNLNIKSNYQLNNTQAIVLYLMKNQILYDKESIYYSNRAVAYRIIQDYDNVKKDALQALQLDNTNVRAYFILGTVHLILGQQEKCLIKASEGVNFLCQAQKHIELKPQLKESVDYNYSQGLILKLKLEKSENYKEFMKLKDDLNSYYGTTINLSNLQYPGTKELFVPNLIECFTCIITQELMFEPILLSSGHTYEKSSINECIRVNGPFDPSTRQILQGNFIPNIQLKNAIVDYQNNALEFQ